MLTRDESEGFEVSSEGLIGLTKLQRYQLFLPFAYSRSLFRWRIAVLTAAFSLYAGQHHFYFTHAAELILELFIVF